MKTPDAASVRRWLGSWLWAIPGAIYYRSDGTRRRPMMLLRLSCNLGWHGRRVPSIWHDEGEPLTECSRCGAVDV